MMGLGSAIAQSDTYHYQLDLTKVQNDRLQVELQAPAIHQKSIRFYMPNIIPGTYMESNYGEYVSGLRAYDRKGNGLPVRRLGKNAWQIDRAARLARLTYEVDDVFDTGKKTDIFGMSGTNIDAGHNFVIHTPGFFGYFEGMKEKPFELTVHKPADFYGSTGLIPVSHSDKADRYRTGDYDALMDSPLMYNRPDTAFVKVANARVLISVYSPNHEVTSDFLAQKYKPLLKAQAEFLGGKLPVDKYAFIFYFSRPDDKRLASGALEHSYSSFYYLMEMPQERIAPLLVDVASHEFFHIVTPLNIHSEEIAYFDYQQPDLSEHLWLYEGVTEYSAHLVQVRSGIISPQEFLDKLADKINTSKEHYDDHLPFTELSKYAAGKYAKEYPNVYQKGALIGAMLDIDLLDTSGGRAGLKELIARLSKRYGKDHPFKDKQLFDVITSMTAPEIGTFFDRYVAGTESLPYKEFFAKAGIEYKQQPPQQVATLGKTLFQFNGEQNLLMISDTTGMNAFGRAMGYRPGDLILELQGQPMNPEMIRKLLKETRTQTAEGDTVRMIVNRKDAKGHYHKVSLEAPAMMVTRPGKYALSLMDHPTYEQLKLRYSWMGLKGHPARPEDVQTIDGLMKALYEVISGPAGERDWNRFYSLYTPEARMAAVGKNKEGKLVYKSVTPDIYRERNEPYFMKHDFWEQEIGRRVFRFGEIASVQSAYAYRNARDGAIEERGVNTLQLVYEKGRWWVTSILWNSERNDNPIPEELVEQ